MNLEEKRDYCKTLHDATGTYRYAYRYVGNLNTGVRDCQTIVLLRRNKPLINADPDE
jgi:hypothetical protein